MNEKRIINRKRLNYYVTVRDRITNQPLGRVVDISDSGIRLFGENQVKLDEVLQLSIELPKEYEMSRQLLFDASGVWNTLDMNPEFPGFYDTGLEFVNISAPDKQLLESLIREYTHRPA
ncbi:MAG TPA: PilZ domain-containing protein [candidate division Zixibacteria bacterium]|nr:PilZ domain-containing protein [candidate division Zixibacteria bacterium]